MAGKVSVPRSLVIAVTIVGVAAVALGVWGGWTIISPMISGGRTDAQTVDEAELYYCPMHPGYTSDKPGTCPACGMDLVPMAGIEREASDGTALVQTAGEAEKETKYTCPMHPQILEDKPGDCPICGMDLVPVDTGGSEEHAEDDEHSAHANPPGYSTVRISSERRQLIGVKTEKASTINIYKTIRTVGVVAVDEKKVAHIHSKVRGWIEKAHINVTGELVRKGDPLLSVYSPELVSAQEEYLMALRARDRISDSAVKEIMTGGSDLVEITRKRLELWDITDDEIARLEKEGKPRKTMVLYAPMTGFITSTKAIDGMYIMPETELYTLADLSTVWVLADIYESELPFVRVGQEAELSLSYLPDRTFSGQVDYIYPILDAKTRTAKVRFAFPNRRLELKPEMYANVRLTQGLGTSLVVPQEAVLDTGEMQVVFVDLGDGRLQPRHVKVGARVDGSIVILEGLSEGEVVVTSANFLIDSESRTKAAFAAIGESAAGGHQH